MVQKTVNVKAKISLKSNAIVWKTDFYYLKSYYFSNIIISKVQI